MIDKEGFMRVGELGVNVGFIKVDGGVSAVWTTPAFSHDWSDEAFTKEAARVEAIGEELTGMLPELYAQYREGQPVK